MQLKSVNPLSHMRCLTLDIKLHYPVILNISPIICISDLKYVKKNGRNSIFSSAQMLTFKNSFLSFGHVLKLSKSLNSALYHVDVLNIDQQDNRLHISFFLMYFYMKYFKL